MRDALKEDVNKYSFLMKKWMMRLGKLTNEEEDELGMQLLNFDEKYLLIRNIEISKSQNFEKSAISGCLKCSESVPLGLKDNVVYCKACSDQACYRLHEY